MPAVVVTVAERDAVSVETVTEAVPRAAVVTVSFPVVSTVPVPPSAVVPDWLTPKV